MRTTDWSASYTNQSQTRESRRGSSSGRQASSSNQRNLRVGVVPIISLFPPFAPLVLPVPFLFGIWHGTSGWYSIKVVVSGCYRLFQIPQMVSRR